jgi:hypothetical protein
MSVDFVPIESGYINRLCGRLGLLQPASRRLLRIVVLLMAAWIPLLLLTAIQGHLAGKAISVSLVRDPQVHTRFLIALPLLEIAEAFVAISLAIQVRQLIESGIIPSGDLQRFETLRTVVRCWHHSPRAESVLFVIAFLAALVLKLTAMPDTQSSWERPGDSISPAGWWHILISLPLLYFFLLRALWVLALWGWFLFGVSRLNLQLTATHPDHAGGLGFLGRGLMTFAPTVSAFSTIVSGGIAYEIYHHGESLDSLKYHLIVYVILLTVLVHLPVVSFVGGLFRCRLFGLLEFSNLVWRHDRAFDEKWIHHPPNEKEPLLGTSDVQSLADIATAYDHVNEMRVVPIDTRAAIGIAICAAIPMVPLIGTEIPIQEIIMKLGELLA